jgi:hypothetical protein
MLSNLRNNSLLGTIPDMLGRLNNLIFLDLSNNQLTGPFPVWAHNLRRLRILNLGQNNIYGEIPTIIGEGRDDGGRPLTNLRQFIRLLSISDAPKHRDLYKTLDLSLIKTFYNRHFQYIMKSDDLLWIDQMGYFSAIILQEMINEYIKAEDGRLLTKSFQSMLLDPLPYIEKLKFLQQTQHKTLRIDDKPRRHITGTSQNGF